MSSINNKLFEWIEEIYKDLKRYSISIAGPDLSDEILNNSILYVVKYKDRLSEQIEDKKHLVNYLKLKTQMELKTYYRNKKNFNESLFREDDEGNFEIREDLFFDNTIKEFSHDQYIDLNKTMSKLTSACRELLIMKSEGNTDKEISNILNVPVNTVSTRYFRCMKKARDFYFNDEAI